MLNRDSHHFFPSKPLFYKGLWCLKNGACPYLIILALGLVGCGGAPVEDAAAQAVVKDYSRGPLAVSMRLERDEASVAETVALEITATTEEGYTVDIPGHDTGDKLGEFTVVDSHTSQPKLLEDGKVAVVQTTELEPFLSGAYTIPAVTVAVEKAGEEKVKRVEVETEPLDVLITSLLEEDVEDPALRDNAPPKDLPRSLRPYIYGLAAVLLLTALAVGAYLLWKRRYGDAAYVPPPIPPHKLALDQLEALMKEKLIEKGHIKRFHIGVSDILRHYLENRFGLRAPERTTEEFLVEVHDSDVLDPDRRGTLRDFLQLCDMVKFARHEPEYEEMRALYDICRRFILDLETIHRAPAGGQAAQPAGEG